MKQKFIHAIVSIIITGSVFITSSKFVDIYNSPKNFFFIVVVLLLSIIMVIICKKFLLPKISQKSIIFGATSLPGPLKGGWELNTTLDVSSIEFTDEIQTTKSLVIYFATDLKTRVKLVPG